MASVIGDSATSTAATAIPTRVPAPSVCSDRRSNRPSNVASAKPNPMIGASSGEISIAPMITGEEFISSPSVAIAVASAICIR